MFHTIISAITCSTYIVKMVNSRSLFRILLQNEKKGKSICVQVHLINDQTDHLLKLKQMTDSLGAFCAIYFLFIHTGDLLLNSILSTYMFEKSRLSS